LSVLGVSIVLGFVGRHPIEEVGERGCGSRVPIIGPHVEGAVGFGDAGPFLVQNNRIQSVFAIANVRFVHCKRRMLAMMGPILWVALATKPVVKIEQWGAGK
jgi:hypothetical protein